MLLRRPIFFLGVLLLMLGFSAPAEAGSSPVIWAGVVYGSNEPGIGRPSGIVSKLRPEFRALFGYRYFRLLGQNSQKIHSTADSWLVPSEFFFLKVVNLHSTPDSRRMRLELFQGQRQVLEAEVRLHRQSPLVIRGPEWGPGRVILVLMYR